MVGVVVAAAVVVSVVSVVAIVVVGVGAIVSVVVAIVVVGVGVVFSNRRKLLKLPNIVAGSPAGGSPVNSRQCLNDFQLCLEESRNC